MDSEKSLPGTSFPSANLFYASIVISFLIIHLTQDRIAWLASLVPTFAASGAFLPKSDWMLIYLPSIKGLLFSASIALVAIPAFQNARAILLTSKARDLIRSIALAAGSAVLLGLLVFSPGSWDMGLYYSKAALNPFIQNAGWYNTRLLMPALAHILFFRGPWLYYAFTMILTIGFLCLLSSWTKDHLSLPFWQFISLCTSSFVIFQYQIGGYPDILVFIFFILVMREDFNENARLSLLLLALVTFEASAVMGVILAWRYLRRRGFVTYVLAVMVYLLIWFAVSGFNMNVILTSHNVVTPGFEWLLRTAAKELLGLFIAYKALWALIVFGIVLALRQKRFADALFITGSILGGISMTVIALDTSRLMGFAFPGLLVALSVIAQTIADKLARRTFVTTFIINLIIPSFYQGLNTGIRWSPGIYKLLYSWIPVLAKKLISG
ncbi:MAG TPA: hypothetical protein VLX61_06640 [Anaerolineales bacterium]|nr:hypothetical protein [Anaerolineales bacterium]